MKLTSALYLLAYVHASYAETKTSNLRPKKERRLGGHDVFPRDNSERLLHREGVIDEIPSSLCGREGGKNVILVIGDGMGWEMIRAGAVAKKVIAELNEMGCYTEYGCEGKDAERAREKFANRTLDDYYTEGKFP